MKGLLDLFGMLLDLIKVQANTNPETPQSEGVDDAYQWFIDTLKDTRNKRVVETNDNKLKPGKIYVFKLNIIILFNKSKLCSFRRSYWI